jgi:plasmid stabilization system protein ParE
VGYLVNILDSAIEDIEQLLSYLQDQWGNDVAKKAYVELMDKLGLLETQPHLGNQVQELVRHGYTNYRLLVHNKHTKVLYQLDDSLQIIHIHMVFSSKQDFQTLLYHRIMRNK